MVADRRDHIHSVSTAAALPDRLVGICLRQLALQNSSYPSLSEYQGVSGEFRNISFTGHHEPSSGYAGEAVSDHRGKAPEPSRQLPVGCLAQGRPADMVSSEQLVDSFRGQNRPAVRRQLSAEEIKRRFRGVSAGFLKACEQFRDTFQIPVGIDHMQSVLYAKHLCCSLCPILFMEKRAAEAGCVRTLNAGNGCQVRRIHTG